MFDVVSSVKEIENEIINFRRELHKIPELGLELPKTVEFVTGELDKMGIEYKKIVNGNAVVALIKGNGEGKTIAIRADMDGLPVAEETGHEFSSTNNCMHACGHDGHTATLLGVAKVLSENKDKFKGNVKLLFQPGEEGPGGAEPMIKEGALENPKVDRILGLHMGNIGKGIPKGNIGVNYGTMMAAVDIMEIKINGKGSHGAYPHQSIDPILTASEIVMSLQSIVSREIDPVEPAVISVTKIEGGRTHNIIPDSVEIQGTIRTTNEDTRKRVQNRIEEVVKGVTIAHRADYEISYKNMYPSLKNSKKVTEELVESAKKVISEDKITNMEKPVMGAEDMSYFLNEVPGTFFYLCNPEEIEGENYPHHNPKFDIDEKEIWKGAAIFIQATLDYLNK